MPSVPITEPVTYDADVQPDQTHTLGTTPSEVTRAIEALLDDPVPSDWDDPTALAARRDLLCAVASEVAVTTLELLTHSKLATARGVALRPDDAVVVASARAIEAMHRQLFR